MRSARPWDGIDLRAALSTTLTLLALAAFVGLCFMRPDAQILACRVAYESARTAADTAKVDESYIGTKQPHRGTCGLLRRNGSLARYEASRGDQ